MKAFFKLITFPIAILLFGILILEFTILKPVFAIWGIEMKVSSSTKDNNTKEKAISTVTKNN